MQDEQADAGKADAKRAGFGRRWLLRLLVLVAVVIGSLMTWSTLERRGLDRRLAALRQAGHPAAPADFNSPPVSDDLNAAVGLRAAARSIDREADSWKAIDDIFPFRLPFTDEELAVVRDAIAPNAAALPLADAALLKPGVGWGLTFQSPMLMAPQPDLAEQRGLANLLRYDALVAHVEGDDSRAVRRAGQLLSLSHAVDQQPTLVGHLVATGIAAIACDVIANVAPDLRVGAGPRDANEAEVRDLVRRLLDDARARAGMTRGLQSDRVMAADAMHALAEGRFNGPAAPVWAGGLQSLAFVKPLVYRNASGSIEHFSALIDTAAATTDWPTFRDTFAAASTPPRRSPRVYFIANMFVPSAERYVQQHYRIVAERRMSAVALAIALHRHQHGGAFPSDLDQLVPAFLSAVPADPFVAGGGKPLGYVNDPARPRVYHVGENGVNDGGTPVDETKSRKENDRVSDHVFDLLRQPKPVRPREFDENEVLPGEDDPIPDDMEAEPPVGPPDASATGLQ